MSSTSVVRIGVRGRAGERVVAEPDAVVRRLGDERRMHAAGRVGPLTDRAGEHVRVGAHRRRRAEVVGAGQVAHLAVVQHAGIGDLAVSPPVERLLVPGEVVAALGRAVDGVDEVLLVARPAAARSGSGGGTSCRSWRRCAGRRGSRGRRPATDVAGAALRVVDDGAPGGEAGGHQRHVERRHDEAAHASVARR